MTSMVRILLVLLAVYQYAFAEIPPSPLKVIYIDLDPNWNEPAEVVSQAVDAGFNVIILAFYLENGPTDVALAWEQAGQAAQQSVMNHVHSKNAVVLVSAGGSTVSTSSLFAATTGTEYGTRVAQWAHANLLDGVDFDLENFAPPMVAGSLTAQQTIQWLIDVSTAARNVLGSSGIISHAPQAPYFGPVNHSDSSIYWTGSTGGYTAVYEGAPNAIDFFNVQFYNQGTSCYVTYDGLFTSSAGSCPDFPGTSVEEIASYGTPLSKIVVGKPVLASDAGNGYVDPSTLGGWVVQAEGQLGWKAGVMGWEFHNSSWIAGIYPTTTPPHHRNAASQPTSESSSSSHLNRGVAGALYYWAKYFCAASLLS